jgi:hypothetical protein
MCWSGNLFNIKGLKILMTVRLFFWVIILLKVYDQVWNQAFKLWPGLFHNSSKPNTDNHKLNYNFIKSWSTWKIGNFPTLQKRSFLEKGPNNQEDKSVASNIDMKQF